MNSSNSDECAVCGHIHRLDETHSFEYVLTNDEINKQCLLCPISMEPLWDPVNLSRPCEHTFSRDMLVKALERTKKCPLCFSAQSKESIRSASLIVKNQLNNLMVLVILFHSFDISKIIQQIHFDDF